jgi:hypothetical protein
MLENYVKRCADKMMTSPDAQFKVCGVVKPGSFTKSLIETKNKKRKA